MPAIRRPEALVVSRALSQRGGLPIGRVDKKWMTVRVKYAVEIDRPEDELVVLGIVLAIDYVKRTEQAGAAAHG